ncbi:kinase-like protein [Mytilinidion resinicola]|uniref:non-specific serine/threonine protein kinase n=1 Tax=Mytilinidion resinicola TaxID=574789 RepID=A0A6A6YA20_9PEZI|nr:kinase-like protein [Mytilinidion resinicola]KAF2805408.1 kinase-like protein [Mytilinidion resinicola]
MSDLVRDSRLKTFFPPDPRQGEVPILTARVFEESGQNPHERLVQRKEVWKRERFIARGAYGSVWLEKCVKGARAQETRAVKQIMRSPQRALGSKKVLDYDTELENFAKFSHRNACAYNRCFVQSFGWYEWENALLIAMEYLPLGDMQDYLLESSRLSEPEGQQVTSQLLEGLLFMHRNGFMHRDLKPKNILIRSKPPQPWWVKIGDFGISRRADTEFSATTAIQGTMGFLAPELHGLVQPSSGRGRHILGASDMWALGETVFRLLTSAASFPTLRELISYAREETPFPAKPLLECGISEAGISFVRELLVVDPRKRATADSRLEHEWILSQGASMEVSRPPSLLFSGLAT